MRRPAVTITIVLAALSMLLVSCGSSSEEVTIYLGRNKNLVLPILNRFAEDTGIDIRFREGATSALAARLIKEGDRTEADVFFAQDAGALAEVEGAGLCAPLPDSVLDKVDEGIRSADGTWVGLSGRARTIVYNTDLVPADEVPDSVLDLTAPEWKGEVAIAPENASFQSFVSGMRIATGDDETQQWLEDLVANDVRTYNNNLSIVDAVAKGEVPLGLVNHYYLPQVKAEEGDVPAENHFLASGDPGALVNIAGMCVTTAARDREASNRLVEWMLEEEAQTFFAQDTFEYPVVAGVDPPPGQPPLDEILGEQVTLADLGGKLESTIPLLEEVGLLQ